MYRSLLRSLASRYFVVAFLTIGVFWVGGCHQTHVNAQTSNAGADPADANMAAVDPTATLSANTSQAARAPGGTPMQNESQQRADEYRQTGQQAGAPTDAQQAGSQGYPQDQNYPSNQAQGYSSQDYPAQSYPSQSYPAQSYPPQGYPADDQVSDDQVNAGQDALEAQQPPPALPQYDQPEAPGPGYMWTPGYWYWGPWGYYWVPGAWVLAPYPGALWTPGYWFFVGPYYRWHPGYWGLHIGFYGGINYGFGYTGYGYYGGYWRGNSFYYNRAVNRVNVTRITNVYDRTVVVNNVNRVSYNGGRGGIQVQPRPAEVAAMREARTPAMSAQVQMRHDAGQNRSQFYSQNGGRPAMTTTARPLTADRGIARPQPGPVHPEYQPSVQQPRPGQPNGQPARQTYAQPAQQEARPQQQARPQPEMQPHPVPEQRPQPQPQPQYRQAPQQQVRPQPEQQYRPQPEMQPRSAPEQRPQYQPQPQNRQAPQQEVRPEPQSQYRAQPQYQPRPVPEQQPQPQYRQGPQQQYRPAPQPEARPQPQMQQHPAPEARPQYQPQMHPAPQQQQRPQESHPAPQPRESQDHGGGSEHHFR